LLFQSSHSDLSILAACCGSSANEENPYGYTALYGTPAADTFTSVENKYVPNTATSSIKIIPVLFEILFTIFPPS